MTVMGVWSVKEKNLAFQRRLMMHHLVWILKLVGHELKHQDVDNDLLTVDICSLVTVLLGAHRHGSHTA